MSEVGSMVEGPPKSPTEASKSFLKAVVDGMDVGTRLARIYVVPALLAGKTMELSLNGQTEASVLSAAAVFGLTAFNLWSVNKAGELETIREKMGTNQLKPTLESPKPASNTPAIDKAKTVNAPALNKAKIIEARTPKPKGIPPV